MKRRTFLKLGVQGGLAAGLMQTMSYAAEIAPGGSDKLGPIMPTRPLANTGERLTLLGIGGAHLGRMDDATAQKHIEFALEHGVRFFDTAYIYQRGRSEKLYGRFLSPKYRDHVFIMTKCWAKTPEKFEQQVNESLRRLDTGQVDLLMVHSLESAADVDERVQNGILDKVRDIKRRGLARHIGYTCHTHPSAVLRFLEKIQDDDSFCSCMTVINPLDAGNLNNSFVRDVLPKTTGRGHAHFAMKTMAGGGLAGGKPPWAKETPKRFPIPGVMSVRENFQFVLSLPITAWVSGTENTDELKHNIDLTKDFTPLSEEEKASLVQRIVGYQGVPYIEQYKTEG